jgi:hypothetical protein
MTSGEGETDCSCEGCCDGSGEEDTASGAIHVDGGDWGCVEPGHNHDDLVAHPRKARDADKEELEDEGLIEA